LKTWKPIAKRPFFIDYQEADFMGECGMIPESSLGMLPKATGFPGKGKKKRNNQAQIL